MRIALVALSFLLPLAVQAQDKKKDFVPAAQAVPKVAERGAPEKAAPKLDGELFVRDNTKLMAEAKWQEAFKILNTLIKATPDSDPAKPELYFRLSEMFWERAGAMEIRAFDDEEGCLERAGKSKQAQAACMAKRKQFLTAAEQYRDKAIKVYVVIVKSFPRYPRLDKVLFALAFNYQKKDKPEAAKKIYIELIRRYPRSVHVPDTLLNVGEIFFDDGKVEQALKAYRKVTTNYRDSDVYEYALYKLGWCYYNVNDYSRALRQFMTVIDYSKKMEQSGRRRRNRVRIRKEARRDLVRTYAHIDGASAKKAVAFFRKVEPEHYTDMSERLAEVYGDTGQFDKSNALYRQLIAQNPKSYKAFGYQLAIVANTRNIGKQVAAVKELKRLVSLWRTVKQAKDAEPKRVAKDEANIEELLRGMAVQYHRQALRTGLDNDYAIAYQLYKDYVVTFPQGKNSYEMTFYYAELLYKLKKWKEAATHYEKTLALQAKGEFTKDAAHGTVLAYKKLLQVKQDIGSGSVSKLGDADDGVPKAKPLPADYAAFIKACGLYVKYVDKSEYLVDIKYDRARIYYDFNQFDKAIPLFKDIAEKHVNHRLAIYAANLLLDIYNLQKDVEALIAQVRIFIPLYPCSRDAEFCALLKQLLEQADFKRCEKNEGKKDWRGASGCYRAYAAKHSGSKYRCKALYNAALNHERMRALEASIQVKLKLVNTCQDPKDKELVAKSLYQIAGNLHALAIFTKASDAYEYYAAQFPKKKEAKEALRNAAFFRRGLGEYDKAIDDYTVYLGLVGRDRKEAADVYFSMGIIYEHEEKWPTVIKHMANYRKRYKGVRPDLFIESYTKTGNALMKMGKSNESRALKQYAAAYKFFKSMKPKDQKALTTGLNAVAEARFKMGEAVYREFKRTKMKPFPFRSVKKFVAGMKKKIKAKTAVIVEAKTIYEEVIQFQSPNWAIAGLARIGQMYQQLANDVYNTPAPGSFNEEQEEIFKGQMNDRGDAVMSKAKEAYGLVLKNTKKWRWFNSWSELAEKQLSIIDPARFRFSAERRGSANVFGPTRIGQALIVALPEEE